jgi:AraC-like DNA-binding protein
MQAVDFVESYFDAWNHHDPKGVADHLTVDGIYRDIPENLQSTHDELVHSLSSFFANYNHRYELIGEILRGENSIAFQYRIHPHGDSDAYNGAEFMLLNGDAAITITDYYDIPVVSRPTSVSAMASGGTQRRKYAKSGLSHSQIRLYKKQLDRIMQGEQLFLRPDLTLPRLADRMDCSVNHLSQVINSGFGMSFFNYLNQHRVQHATDLLNNHDARNDAILNIAFAAGFNSNSAFYAAFKKCVGQTPAQYRKSQLEKPH